MIAVDTNVLIYAVDFDEAVKSRLAQGLLQTLVQQNAPLVVPWQVASEFLACLRRWEASNRIGANDVQAYLNSFILRLPMVYPTVASLAISVELNNTYSLSHWDSMLLAACVEAGIDTIYSEDLSNNTTYGSVRVINPFLQSP